MNELKVKEWKIKWDGENEGFTNGDNFVLLDEDKDSTIYIWFESETFSVVQRKHLYGHRVVIDAPNKSIYIKEDEE